MSDDTINKQPGIPGFGMSEEPAKNSELSEDQLGDVSGGAARIDKSTPLLAKALCDNESLGVTDPPLKVNTT